MASAAPSAGPAFSSSRVVRFGDMAEDEKEAFTKYMVEQKVQFFKDTDGSYVANIRLYDPNVIDMAAYQRSKQGSKKDSRRGRSAGGDESAPAAAVEVSASAYPRFTSLIQTRDAVKPKTRPLAWLMRLIEELYDARYARDTADLRGDGDEPSGASVPFPVFVVDFFTKRYGLRSLIDQTCWDLVHNLHLCRRDNLEAEIFARFLESYYDPDDLLFFLYVRSVIQKELGVSFKTRWSELGRPAASSTDSPSAAKPSGPAPVFLSLRDCQIVSRVVFGSESDPLYRTFIAMIERHLVAEPASSRRGAATRRIDASQFLHLALVEYHETRPVDDRSAMGGEGDGLSASFSALSTDEASDRLVAAAETSYDRAAATTSGVAVTAAAAASAAAALRRSPQFFDELGEAMHRSNEAYLDALLSAGGASTLPGEVRAQIRAEVTQRLEPKVDALLASTIKAVQAGASGSAASVTAAAGSAAPLVPHFLAVILGSDPAASVSTFCEAVLAQEEVRKAVEPLVSLLISYAAKRLQDATASA